MEIASGVEPGNLGPPLWHDKKTPSFHQQPRLEARMQTWVAVGSGLESHWDVKRSYGEKMGQENPSTMEILT